MALSSQLGPEAQPRVAPAWIGGVWFGGLALTYVGQRVVVDSDTASLSLTVLGLAAVVAGVVLRFAPRFRVGGERRESEQLFAVLAVVGLVGVALGLCSTEAGLRAVGISRLPEASRELWTNLLIVAWVSLCSLAVVTTLFAEVAMAPMRRAQRVEARRVRAAATAGAALTLTGISGALLVYAATGPDWKADYSYFKTSAASDSTKAVAKGLTETVRVVAFFPDVGEVRPEVERYLRDVAKAAPKLEIEIWDRLRAPKLARELRATQDGVIVLAQGTATQTLTVGADPKTAKPKLKTLDKDFQEQLLKLSRPRRTAYLTTGHGEITDPPRTAGGESIRNARGVRTILQKQNYLVKELGLTQGLGSEVPNDADVVLVLGPTEPLAPEELASLRRYADRGGKLFIALDPDALSEIDALPNEAPAAMPSGAPASSSAPVKSATTPSATPAASAAKSAAALASAKPAPSASAAPATSALPSASAAAKPPAAPPSPAAAGSPAPTSAVDALASLVGLSALPGVLADEQRHLARTYNDSDRTLVVTNRFSSHASVSTLSRNSQRAGVILAGAAALERRPGGSQKIDFAVRSLPTSFLDLDRDYRAGDAEKKNTYNLAAAVEAPLPGAPPPTPEKPGDKPEKKAPAGLRAFVLADADALTDAVLQASVANQLLFVDAVRWLGGEESYAGEINSEEDVQIEHTKQKDLFWFYATIFGVPALVMGLGAWNVRRAQRKGRA